jgi:hypothetical protein
LIDRRRDSSILDIRSFRGADCDTYHYLLVANFWERLAVSKQTVNEMDVDRFNLKILNEGEVKEQYQVSIKNRFSAVENLQDNGDINRAWDATRANIKISAKRSIGHCEKKSVIYHGLMRNVQNSLIEGNRPNYSGCRIHVYGVKIM